MQTVESQKAEKILAQLTREAGFTLFDDSGYDATSRAERNLQGRTHYVDASTRRFFRARVLKCSVLAEGMILGILESASGDHEHKTRVFRPVFFDLDGFVLSRPKLEESFRTRKAAEREFWRVANSLDGIAVNRAMLARVAKRDAETVTRILGVLNA